MFKKLLLIALVGANLHAEEPSQSFTLFNSGISPTESVGIGLAAYLLCDVIPQVLKTSKVNDKIEQGTVTSLKSLNTAAQITLAIYCAAKLCVVAKDLYDYCYPSETQKAITQAAAKVNKLFRAKQGFRTCLMNNATSPRNDSGIPTACQELANAFGAVAGQPALDEMTTNFKDAY